MAVGESPKEEARFMVHCYAVTIARAMGAFLRHRLSTSIFNLVNSDVRSSLEWPIFFAPRPHSRVQSFLIAALWLATAIPGAATTIAGQIIDASTANLSSIPSSRSGGFRSPG
jgi:hypothetical protein